MTKYGVQASFFLSQLLRSNFIHGLCLDEKTGDRCQCAVFTETLLLLRVWKQTYKCRNLLFFALLGYFNYSKKVRILVNCLD